jgi:hypothetical protein
VQPTVDSMESMTDANGKIPSPSLLVWVEAGGTKELSPCPALLGRPPFTQSYGMRAGGERRRRNFSLKPDSQITGFGSWPFPALTRAIGNGYVNAVHYFGGGIQMSSFPDE